MPKCTKCQSNKPITDFPSYKLRNGEYSVRGHCKQCDYEYKRQHYLTHQDQYRANLRASRARKKEMK